MIAHTTHGRYNMSIWNVHSDTVCDLGGATELANYGEYSGDPSETQTYEYAKTLLSIMTEGAPHPKGKVRYSRQEYGRG